MRKAILTITILVLANLSMFLAFTSQVRADPSTVISGGLTLYGSGFNESGEPDPAFADQVLSDVGPTVQLSKNFTSYFRYFDYDTQTWKIASYMSNGSISGAPGRLVVSATGSGNHDNYPYGPYGEARVAVQWVDTATLVKPCNAPPTVQFPSELVFTYQFHGTVKSAISGEEARSGASAWIQAWLDSTDYPPYQVVTDPSDPEAKEQPFTTVITGTVPVASGIGFFSSFLQADGFAAKGTGSATGDLTLQSITLPDGSTPEAQGWTLGFESGMKSPNPPPETEYELSGASWVNKFHGSRKRAKLTEPFKGNFERFLFALIDAGAKPHIESTYRPKERQKLMYWAWQIARKGVSPKKGDEKRGDIKICWEHKKANGETDLEASRRAAEEMVKKYKITSEPCNPDIKICNHTVGWAVDMTLKWKGELKIMDKKDNPITIGSSPKSEMNHKLWDVAASYGVKKYGYGQPDLKPENDKEHWSKNGR